MHSEHASCTARTACAASCTSRTVLQGNAKAPAAEPEFRQQATHLLQKPRALLWIQQVCRTSLQDDQHQPCGSQQHFSSGPARYSHNCGGGAAAAHLQPLELSPAWQQLGLGRFHLCPVAVGHELSHCCRHILLVPRADEHLCQEQQQWLQQLQVAFMPCRGSTPDTQHQCSHRNRCCQESSPHRPGQQTHQQWTCLCPVSLPSRGTSCPTS